MSQYISDVAFTPAVKKQQEDKGSRATYERMASQRDWQQKISKELREFIAQMDSFYLATSNADGQPYIQHRGGPAGFLKVLDEETLVFADYSGNRQFISLGNLSENDKVHLFLMDYPSRTRIKIWGTARFVEGDEALTQQVMDADYRARPERVFLIKITAWDVNCPQHIAPRYTVEQIEPQLEKLKSQIKDLEEKLENCEPKE